MIDLLIETLEQQGDSDALRKARLGKRALQTMDSVYFTHQSFQDGDPEDYLQIYPSTNLYIYTYGVHGACTEVGEDAAHVYAATNTSISIHKSTYPSTAQGLALICVYGATKG